MWKLIYLFLFFPIILYAGPSDLLRGHSHNDYEQKHPLFDALNAGLNSVEADIWFRNGQILVSHVGLNFRGTLEDLYLKPLQKMADQKGFIQKNNQTFYLWLDIKDKNPHLRSLLKSILERYSMLSRFGQKAKEGAVTIILTGNAQAKELLVGETEFACRDSNGFSINDPIGDSRWAWYGISWHNLFGVAFTKSDEKKLQSIVSNIHAKGRKVRVFAIPNRKSEWRRAYKAGVDQISADDLPSLANFLRNL